jgi:ketosteroid isomerase-like protein
MHEVMRPFNARMRSPLRPTIRNIYADGDDRLFDARATARDGKPYANTYAWFLDMVSAAVGGGRVTSVGGELSGADRPEAA